MILEGSSVWNTDGSLPTDYGSDISDVPMEDGEVPSSAADSESAAVAHDPVTGSRRPREDDPSASSSKRSRNDDEEEAVPPVTPSSPRSVPAERAPWMPSAPEIASRLGATSPPSQIPLYVCSAIIDDAEAAAQHFAPMTNQRRDYFIELFHELRWHASKKTSRKSKVPEWMALCQSWNAFVENFNKDAKAYRALITAAQRRFETFSRRHMIDRLHNEAMEAGIPPHRASLIDDVKAACASDADAKQLLSYASAPSDEARRKLAPHLRARAHRYRVHEGLLLYSAVDDDVVHIVVPNDYDLRMRIMYEYHDAPTAGHPGREKTYVLLTRDLYWNHQYK
ncbi:hypothetical protein PC120_g7406 [Phytophthora cactorum]|nr:hypothetical protein PC120_g7406 [Phytophthora cactorum]